MTLRHQTTPPPPPLFCRALHRPTIITKAIMYVTGNSFPMSLARSVSVAVIFLNSSPLPNISTSSSPAKCDSGTPKTLSKEKPENSRGEIQGFLLKNIGMPSKRPIQGTPGNSFCGVPKPAFWGWRMRMAKVDMFSERKRHINFFSHKLSVPPFVPGTVPGTIPGLSQGQTR